MWVGQQALITPPEHVRPSQAAPADCRVTAYDSIALGARTPDSIRKDSRRGSPVQRRFCEEKSAGERKQMFASGAETREKSPIQARSGLAYTSQGEIYGFSWLAFRKRCDAQIRARPKAFDLMRSGAMDRRGFTLLEVIDGRGSARGASDA